MNIQVIDTRHGVANQHSFSNGNYLPYTGVPFGMNFYASQTTDQKGSRWFHPEDRTFQGYRVTHQPSPWMGDFSHLLVIPVSGSLSEPSLLHAQSSYRPEESLFSPVEINLTQLRYQITPQLIPGMYGGILTIDYHQKDSHLLLILPGRYQVRQSDDHQVAVKVINYSSCEDPDFSFYFVLHFEQPLAKWFVPSSGEDGKILLPFGNIAQQVVHFSNSLISEKQAQLSLTRGILLRSTEMLRQGIADWHNYFDRLRVTHENPGHTKTLYHTLY